MALGWGWGSQERCWDASVSCTSLVGTCTYCSCKCCLLWAGKSSCKKIKNWRCWYIRYDELLGSPVVPELCYHPSTPGGIPEGMEHQLPALGEPGWNKGEALLRPHPLHLDLVCSRAFFLPVLAAFLWEKCLLKENPRQKLLLVLLLFLHKSIFYSLSSLILSSLMLSHHSKHISCVDNMQSEAIILYSLEVIFLFVVIIFVQHCGLSVLLPCI